MNSVDESLHFFAQVGAAFHTSASSLWSKYPDHDRDPWDALGIFLEGYAFERQGRKPDYAHVAADVVREMKDSKVLVTDPGCQTKMWDRFSALLGNERLNEKVNPLSPKFTDRPSAIEVAARLAPTTMTALAMQCLKGDRTGEAVALLDKINGVGPLALTDESPLMKMVALLDKINGVGPKIARLFLRDIATEFVPPSAVDLHQLLPVDIHVRRISQKLRGKKAKKDEEITAWIVEQSEKAHLKALYVNSGMWHFGSLIASSAYLASKALDDLPYATKLVDTYMDRQRQIVDNWQGKR